MLGGQMKAPRPVVVLVIAFGLFAKVMVSQTVAAKSLRGIKAVNILVDGVDGNACGISKDEVITSVKFIVGQSAIHLTEEQTPFAIYVNIASSDGCTASSVSVQMLAEVTINGSGEYDGAATIWNKGEILTGPHEKMEILGDIESMCKRLVVDWASVNKK
jgi:hypothetical protein